MFEDLLWVFKSLYDQASYLSELLICYIPAHNLCTTNESLLVVPRTRQKMWGGIELLVLSLLGSGIASL